MESEPKIIPVLDGSRQVGAEIRKPESEPERGMEKGVDRTSGMKSRDIPGVRHAAVTLELSPLGLDRGTNNPMQLHWGK